MFSRDTRAPAAYTGNFRDRFRAPYPSISSRVSPRDIDSGRFNGDDLDEIKRRAVSPSAIREPRLLPCIASSRIVSARDNAAASFLSGRQALSQRAAAGEIREESSGCG